MRARIFRSGRVSPLAVTCVQLCTTTVSARCFIWAMIQSPARRAAAVPGTRGPKSSWVFTYARLASPLNAVRGRWKRSHAPIETRKQATNGSGSVLLTIGTLRGRLDTRRVTFADGELPRWELATRPELA